MDVHELLESALAASLDAEAQGSLAVVTDVLARCQVRPDPDTTTLSISLGERRCILLVNEDFISEQVQNSADALFVCGHESEHVICDHGALPKIPGVPAAVINVGLDLQVNGALLRGLIEPTPGILGRLYRLDRFPELLLRPPTDLIDRLAATDPEAEIFANQTVRRLTRVIDGDPLTRARLETILLSHFTRVTDLDRPEAMVRAYLDGWCVAQESRSWLLRFLRLLGRDGLHEGWESVPLLGDHRRRDQAKSSRWSRAWGWSRSRHAEDLDLDLEPTPAVLMERFMAAAQRAMQPWLDDSEPPTPVPDTSIIPNPGRREQVLRAAGITPIVYQHRTTSPLEPRQMVHLYLDVSGSMARQRYWYGGLVRVLGERLAEPVWVWSTQVEEASRADIVQGRMRTYGGTCIEPVIDHAIEQGFQRVLVLSDGEFGFDGDVLAKKVKEAGLEMVFVLLVSRTRRSVREQLGQIAVEVVEVRC